ncbi:MAG TPA: hypothetical protein VEU06_08340 [Micropepsaceae bacterium]|nr:hypothetical protein [Micropepsaceae bacterium]
MRRIAAAGLIAAVVTMASCLAFASDHVLGTVKSVDVFARIVVLEDGASYPVLRGIDLAKFKTGDKVVLETADRKGTTTIIKLSKGDRVPIMLPNQPTNRSRVP